MLKLNLREIAKDLDVAIDSLEQAQRIFIGLENGTVTDEHRDKIRELSNRNNGAGESYAFMQYAAGYSWDCQCIRGFQRCSFAY